MAENLLKVIHVLEGLQQAEHLRLAVGELQVDVGVPKTTVSKILMQDLGMKCVVARFVPQLLLPEQQEHHAAVANDLIQTATNEPDFLKRL